MCFSFQSSVVCASNPQSSPNPNSEILRNLVHDRLRSLDHSTLANCYQHIHIF